MTRPPWMARWFTRRCNYPEFRSQFRRNRTHTRQFTEETSFVSGPGLSRAGPIRKGSGLSPRWKRDHHASLSEEEDQGLKPLNSSNSAARLKPCPDTSEMLPVLLNQPSLLPAPRKEAGAKRERIDMLQPFTRCCASVRWARRHSSSYSFVMPILFIRTLCCLGVSAGAAP